MSPTYIQRILRHKRVAVVTHVYGTGASQDLVRFLTKIKTQHVLFIGHPLFYDPKLKGSGFDEYQAGKRVGERYLPLFRFPLFVGFFCHILLTLFWIFFRKEKWDLYVGSNNINAFTGLILKKLGKVGKVVYYVIDYNPWRYDNKLLNSLYHSLDKYCVIHADATWNLSPRMEEGREKFFHFTGGRQSVVPVGIWKEDIARVPKNKIKLHTIVFLGHILKKQGIQHIVKAMPLIKKKIKDIHFIVLGGGEYLEHLRALAFRLHIDASITFAGFIKDHKQIDEIMKYCALGLALYERKDNGKLNFTYFANPTKLKSYAAMGLPVLVSDVPYNATELAHAGAGRIITSSPTVIAREVIEILKNPGTLFRMRQNVIIYRRKFDWENIFSKAIGELL